MRQNMGMFVRIHVRNSDACLLQLPNLRRRLGFDLLGVDLSCDDAPGEGDQGLMELRAGTGDEAGNFLLRQYRSSVHQDDMATDPELGISTSQGNGVVKRRAIRHQGSRGHNAIAVCLGDGAVYALSKPEVIRVDDEPAQSDSLAGRRCRH